MYIFKNAWRKDVAVLLLVFFSSSVMQLQFSSTYLLLPVFWFFLGMCSTMIRDTNKESFLKTKTPDF